MHIVSEFTDLMHFTNTENLVFQEKKIYFLLFNIVHIISSYLNNIPFPLFLKKELGSKTSKAVATN